MRVAILIICTVYKSKLILQFTKDDTSIIVLKVKQFNLYCKYYVIISPIHYYTKNVNFKQDKASGVLWFSVFNFLSKIHDLHYKMQYTRTQYLQVDFNQNALNCVKKILPFLVKKCFILNTVFKKKKKNKLFLVLNNNNILNSFIFFRIFFMQIMLKTYQNCILY